MRYLIILLLCISLTATAQELKKKNAPFTVRGNVGIPRAITSNMYRSTFVGLYEANLSFNARLFSNFYAGFGYQNTMFQNGKFLKYKYFNASIPYNTNLMYQNIFLKLGYDRFSSENFYVSYSVNTGVALAKYSNVNEDTSAVNRPYGSIKFSTAFVQPEVSFNFVVDKTLSFSFMFGYTTMFTNFNPKSPRFNQFEEVNKKSNNYFISWFTFGFGFNVLLGKY